MIKINPGQVSVEQAFAFCKLFGDRLSIRAVYWDDQHGKMPAEYDTLEEALLDETRYGSIFLHLPDGVQRQVAPDSEEEYLSELKS